MLKVKTPDGYVFIRDTTNGYTCALASSKDGQRWTVTTWHRRADLAAKEAGKHYYRGYRTEIVTVGDWHGTCGRCDGEGRITCTKCRGRVDVPINRTFWDEAGHRHEEYHHTFHCTCKTGKRKCSACQGKGQL